MFVLATKCSGRRLAPKEKRALYRSGGHYIRSGGASPKGFHASDDQPTDSAQIKSNSSLVGGHENSLSAVDKDTNRLYVDDPKIIIGRGPTDILEDIQKLCGQLASSFKDEAKAKEAKKTCEDAEQKLNKLLHEKKWHGISRNAIRSPQRHLRPTRRLFACFLAVFMASQHS